MARRTKQEAGETRESLLDAAELVFLDRGVARASLDEVARVAGCTRGAVHWHFGDKLGLFLALDERLVLIEDEVRQRLMPDGDCVRLGDIERMIPECMSELELDKRRIRLLTVMLQRCEYVEEMTPALDRRRRADLAMRDVLYHCFERAAERGELSPRWQPKQAAICLHAMIDGIMGEWLRGDADFILSIRVREVLQVFFACLREDSPATPMPA